MLLTIALLTKNSEETVRFALKSILRQNIPLDVMLELIIVDGGSTDNTLKIVENDVDRLRAKFGTRLIRHQILHERVSVGFARDLALKKASGEWILWVDSDNVLGQDYILKALHEIQKYKDKKIAVLYPSRVVAINKDRKFGSKLISCYNNLQYCPPIRLRFLADRLVDEDLIQKFLPYPAMQGSLCNSNVLRVVGGFNSYLVAAEDVDVYLRILNNGFSMKQIPNSTLFYFSRRTLDAWFKQAMFWSYGKEILIQVRGKDFLQYQRVRRPSPNALILSSISRSLALLAKGVKVCGVSGLFIPWAYIYRRSGYIKGYLCALDQQEYVRRIGLPRASA